MVLRNNETTGSGVNRLYAHVFYEGLSELCEGSEFVKRVAIGKNAEATRWRVVNTTDDPEGWPFFKGDSKYGPIDPRRYGLSKALMREVVVLTTEAAAVRAQQTETANSTLAVAYTVGRLGRAAVVAGALRDISDHEGAIQVALRAGPVGRNAAIGVMAGDVFTAAVAGTALDPPEPFPEGRLPNYDVVLQ